MKKAVVVVSLGTETVEDIEKAIANIEREIETTPSFADYDIKRAFIKKDVIKSLNKRKYNVKNLEQTLIELKNEQYSIVVIQPTIIMNGYEYEKILDTVKYYKSSFSILTCGTPLLTSLMDYCEVIVTLASEASLYDDDTAIVFVGHGTSHYASACYPALDYMLKEKGFSNIYMGTVEGYPSCDTVKRYIGGNYKKIVLYPFMIANGEHSYTDIAGDGDSSWKMTLRKSGYDTKFVLKGLGEYNQIGRIFAEHASESMVE